MSINLQGNLDGIILKIISNKDEYGYAIIADIYDASNELYLLNEQSLYTALHRLVKNGYTEQYWSDDSSNGGRRKYYKITEEGKKRLKEIANEWKDTKKIVDLYLEEKGKIT